MVCVPTSVATIGEQVDAISAAGGIYTSQHTTVAYSLLCPTRLALGNLCC